MIPTDKVREVFTRFSELEARLSEPDIAADPLRYARLRREYLSLTPLAEAYRALLAAEKAGADASEMAADPANEPDLRALAEEEAKAASAEAARLSEQIRYLLLPKDEKDERNVIVEIRAGAGGEEAALFAADLYRMYRMYADASGFHTELLGANETELGGFREVSFRVNGSCVYAKMKFESGVHRVQRVPVTESQGRIQTSTVTVAVLPEAEEVEVELNPADLKIESMKSSGAGGQHINKTESAVRILHIPTGIVVACQTQRSQLQNKEAALRMLRTRLYDIKQSEQAEKIATTRKTQVGTGDRSEKIRTYNYPQGRVTDHRIGFSLYNLGAFLNGDIASMIEALITADTAEKLKKQESC